VMVGVREAAQLAGVSTKQVRKWIREGAVRAEQVAGKFGPTWQIEAASIPLSRRPLEAGIPRVGQGLALESEASGNGWARGEAGAMAALVARCFPTSSGGMRRRWPGWASLKEARRQCP